MKGKFIIIGLMLLFSLISLGFCQVTVLGPVELATKLKNYQDETYGIGSKINF